MNSVVIHQKIQKRPFRPSVSKRKRDKKQPTVHRSVAQRLEKKSGNIPIFLRSIIKKAARINRTSFFIGACIFVLVTLLFFTSSVPTTGMVQENPVRFPEDEQVEQFLYSYINPEKNWQRDEEIRLPQPEILSSLNPSTYTIRKGDTLSELSSQYKVSLSTLLSFNNIKDVRKLQVGTEIKIPKTDGVLYTVKKGDSLSVISYREHVPLNDILDANGLESAIIRPGQELFLPGASISDFELKKATGELFIYPTVGALASPYGMRNDPFTGVWRMHYGIDISNRIGTTVKASMEGRVGLVGLNHKGYGRYIIINHQGGFQSLYAHLNKALVTKGEWVRQGQKIGEMGNTGRSTGPHLHFGIYRYQNPVDPDTFLF